LDGVTEGAIELILAIFRMAVADYQCLAYGHDGPGRPRAVHPHHRADAELFLRGPWAQCLGDWINLPAEALWRQAQTMAAPASRSSSVSPGLRKSGSSHEHPAAA
jgi:hypothetical protein